ncbi:MAG: DNA-binding protein [Candidatus Anstonellales archaeon]
MVESLESIRERKIRKRLEEMQKRQEAEAQLRAVLRMILTDEAYERIMNVRISNPELFARFSAALAQAASSGRIRQKISDAQLKDMLSQFTEKRETRIEFIKK